MPKNKIGDLRNLMMETIERLMDPDDPMDAKTGIAVSQLGNVVLNSAKIELQAAKMLGNQNPTFFAESGGGGGEPKQLSPVRHDLEIPNCKCGDEIYPADFERSENLKLNYPRCAECISLLSDNVEVMGGSGK